mgnify:CR=1 FL=1
MELATMQEGSVVSVSVKGRLDSVGADLLKARVSQLIDSGTVRLVIDFGQVAYISSAGFRALFLVSILSALVLGCGADAQ